MGELNLFTMLSAYRPNSRATPFENYCTSGLAYFLKRGQRMLTALITGAAGITGEALAMVEVQPQIADAGTADLLLTFEGGRRVIVEVDIDAVSGPATLEPLQQAASHWSEPAGFIVVGVQPTSLPPPWQPISWLEVAEALEDDPDLLAREYAQFVLHDIMGLGEVSLDEAITTNRLYALGAAAVRRRFGAGARYVNSASRPTGGRYRYLGTTFSPEGTEPTYWIGIVNEGVPLSDHYHLMLASKENPIARPASQPRATGDWKWSYWTGAGRVVRPITIASYDDLLARLGG